MSRTPRLYQARLQIESLEGRALPAQVEWINPAGGDWAVPSNWSTGQLPGADDDVIIDLPEDFTVAHTSGISAIRSLLSRETLVLAGGTLTLATDSVLNGNFTLSGGTLDGAGTVTLNSAFSWSAGAVRGSSPSTRLVANRPLTIWGPDEKVLARRSLEVLDQGALNGGSLVLTEAAFTVGLLAHVEWHGGRFRDMAASRFTNHGSVFLWNAEIATHWVDNTGRLTVFGGRLDLGIPRGAVSNTGVVQLTAQATVQSSADSISFGGVVRGSGNLGFGGESVGMSALVELEGRVGVAGARLARVSGSIHASALSISASRWTLAGAIETAEVILDGMGDGEISGSVTTSSLLVGPGYTVMSDTVVTADVFENRGSLDLWDATVAADTLVNNGRFFLQRGTTVTAPTFVNHGWLNGVGLINGDVINDGWVVVGGLSSAGVLRINGNFIQTTHGELFVWLGGTEPGTGYSQLDVSGLAILGGSLVVRVQDGFAPQEGDSFAVLNFAGRVGRFASIDVPQFEDELSLDPAYGDVSLTLIARHR